MKKRIFGILLLLLLLTPKATSAANNPESIKARIMDGAKSVSVSVLEDESQVIEKEEDIEVEEDNLENKPTDEVEIPVEEISYDIQEGARTIPILMFHEVGYQDSKEYSDANYILKHGLEHKMMYLAANNYKTITMEDLYNNWINGKELPEKTVVLTFDDGYASHFSFVKDVFQRFNATGTFYIIQDRLFMGMDGRNLEGLKSLAETGMEIGVHSYSHPDFTNMTYDEIYKEVATSKTFLEDNLGIKMTTFSYPFGNYNEAAIQVLKDLEFKTAVTTKMGVGNPFQFKNDGILKISRYNIDKNTSDEEFIKMLEGSY